MNLLRLENVSLRRNQRDVLADITLSVEAGEVVGLLGPNGAGKTTLLRAALGLVAHKGNSSLAALPSHERARHVAWLPQTRLIAWPVSVETAVSLGRLPYRPVGRPLSSEDQVAVDQALERMNLTALRHRKATELSGGEQARVLIARTLAQGAPLLLADEPTAGLDPAAQISTMRVFRSLAEGGGGVLVSLHDLGLAARHCDRIVLLLHGRIVASGPPEEILTPSNLAHVFGVVGHYAMTEAGPVFQPLEVVG